MPGSGKGELSKVAAELGIRVVSLGDIVRGHFMEHNTEWGGEMVGIYAAREREAHGQDIWARRLLDVIGSGGPEADRLLIVDGLRSVYEADLLRKELGGDFMVLAVHSSPSVRFERLVKRGRSDSPVTRADFDERDRRELSWGMGEVISTADMMLVNEGDLESFRRTVRDLLKGLGGLS